MLSFLWQNMFDMRATWLTHPHDPSAVLHPFWACYFLQQQWMTRQDAVLINADVRAEIIALAGEPQYFFLGLVSRSWRGWFIHSSQVTIKTNLLAELKHQAPN